MESIVNLVVAQEDSKSQASSSQVVVQTSGTHVSARMDQLQSAHATKQSGKYLSRLVAKGFNQKEGINYKETFAPVAKMVSVRALIAVATHHNWIIEQLDINIAFLHGDLDEEVYMIVPKATPLHFLPTHYVNTLLFTLTKGSSFTTLLIYVDDILLTGSLVMSQRKYALDLLQCANMLNHKRSTIHLDPIKTLNSTDEVPLNDHSLYKKLVGKLIYPIITRHDLSFAAQALRQFSHQLRTTHMAALYKVLRYINLCLRQGLHFPKGSPLQLSAYCNSDWAACPISKRSVSGYAVF
ncbi:retrovirus-related pol polyprotein from transposon TNT 1-94 [Tanacetum coccineum]